MANKSHQYLPSRPYLSALFESWNKSYFIERTSIPGSINCRSDDKQNWATRDGIGELINDSCANISSIRSQLCVRDTQDPSPARPNLRALSVIYLETLVAHRITITENREVEYNTRSRITTFVINIHVPSSYNDGT